MVSSKEIIDFISNYPAYAPYLVLLAVAYGIFKWADKITHITIDRDQKKKG